MEPAVWEQDQVEQELLMLQPHENNIVELLDSGLLKRIKLLSEEKAARHRRILKKILVKKYFKRADEGHRRRIDLAPRPRTKIIQKPQERKEEVLERQPKDI